MKQLKVDYHEPVLLKESIDYLIQDKGGLYFDGTLGGGGHASYILKKLNTKGRLIAVDRDLEAIDRAKIKFNKEHRIKILHTCFSNLDNLCSDQSLNGVLLDLGVSSHQFDQPYRGFSFEHEQSPLDMRMNQQASRTAVDYINQSTQREITQAFFNNSDIAFPLARNISRILKERIISNQSVSVVRETLQEIYPMGVYNQSKLFSQIFQAIRIEVNNEKKEIENTLQIAVKKLIIGGVICVISFHSVEDRWVKHSFKKYEDNCICPTESPICQCGGNQKILKKQIKKPITPTPLEVQLNSRSRSAKLRIMEKIR